MYQTIAKFPFFGVEWRVNPSLIVGSAIIIGVLIALARNADLSGGETVLVVVACFVLYWIFAIIHHTGHIWAARRVGHPSEAVQGWWAISLDIYPKDEPELPAEVHIQRALGGPRFSIVAMILAAIFAALTVTGDDAIAFIGWFSLAVGVMYGIVPLFPAPAILETDGNTLMRWWPRRGQST